MPNQVEGIQEALANLNRETRLIKESGLGGLLRAGLYIEGEAKKLAPVDTGNLRASGYSRMAPDGGLGVEVGFSAHYALPVHENLEQKLKGEPRAHFGQTRAGVEFGGGSGKGRYWDSGEPKFLEKPLTRHQKILAIMAGEMTLK